MRKNVRPKPFIGLAVVIGLLASGVWAYQWWNSPAVSKPLNSAPAANTVLGSDTELRSWQTAYFTTQIPTFLRSRTTTENPNLSQLGQYLLTSTTPSKSDQVAITVGKLGNSSLGEQSAVRLRQARPTEYTPTTRGFAPADAYVFSRVSSYETAIFWQHDDRYVAAVVSGTIDRKPDLEAALAVIVSDWKWN